MKAMPAMLFVGAVLGAGAWQHVHAQAEPTTKGGTQPQTAAKPKPKQSAAAGAFDPKADQLLHKMSTDLASMKAFSFDANHVLEVVTNDGERIHGLAESTVMVERPNKLATDRLGPLGGAKLFYDGKNLTVFAKKDNLFATAPAPKTLDDAIDFARDSLSIDAPGADLLYSDPYKILMEDAVSGQYMGMDPVGGRTCHHLAYRGHETDWQIWIDDGPRALPCRFVITSKKETGSPEYTVTMSNWREETSLPPDTFTFAAPRDAAKIEFVRVSDDIAKQKQRTPR